MYLLPPITPIPAPYESELEAASMQLYREVTQAGGEVFIGGAGGGGASAAIPVVGVEWQILIALVPAACTAIGAWLGSRNGQKLRIKIGDIEAEAQTQEQVEELLALAQKKQQEIQQRNQPPKVIL